MKTKTTVKISGADEVGTLHELYAQDNENLKWVTIEMKIVGVHESDCISIPKTFIPDLISALQKLHHTNK